MAINKKLLHFVSKANFSTQLANSNIDSKSIVFIKDTGEIWTHDKLYSCASWGTNQTNYVPLTIGGTSYNLSKDGHTHSYLPLSGGQLTGQLSLLQGAGGGIIFPNDSFGGGGDSASIKLLNPAGGESTEMTFTMTNDADDIINFSVPSIDGVKINRYTVWNAGNFTNLNQLTTRNFSDLQNIPTTLLGYGITDALLKSDINIQVGGTKNSQMSWTSWNNSDVYGGAIQLREYGYVTSTQSDWYYSPAITFHWGNRNVKRFGMRSDGQFAIDNNPILWSGNYSSYALPLSGGTLSGNLFIPNNAAIIQNQASTSNYTAAIKWYKGGVSQNIYDPQIGQYNEGGGTGAITILPYSTNIEPWVGTVGLYLTGAVIKFNNNIIYHSGNFNPDSKANTSGTYSGLNVGYATSAGNLSNFTNQSGSRYGTDFNTILTTGFFNAEGTPLNAPAQYGQLIVAKGVDTGLQIYGGYVNDNLWFRGWGSSGAVFSAWRSVIHSGNIASQSVNYATNAGNADTVDSQHFTYSNTSDSPTYLWGTNTYGTNFLVNRANMSVNYAAYSGYSTRLQVIDNRGTDVLPDSYSDYRVTPFFNESTGVGTWASGITVAGWHAGYSRWQIFGYSSTGSNDNLYFRSQTAGGTNTWNTLRTILHSGNYTAYSPSLTGSGASGTWGISITGNADTVDGLHSSNIVSGGSNKKSINLSSGNANTSDSTNASGFYYGSNTTGMPSTDWWNWITCAGDAWTGTDGYGYQLGMSFWSDDFRVRRLTSGAWQSWQSILHTGNYTNWAVSLGIAQAITAAHNFTSHSLTMSPHYYHGSYDGQNHYIHMYPNGGIGTNYSNTHMRFWNGSGSFIEMVMQGNGYWTWNGNTVWHSGNDGSGSGLDADLLDGLQKTSFAQEYNYSTTAQNSGWYKIKILSTVSWMLCFTIRVYQDYNYYDIVVSGYQYGSNYWHEPKAKLITSSFNAVDVKFGHDSVNDLWVAIPAGSYTGLKICNITNGYQQVSDWSTKFSITNETTLSGTVDATITAKRPLVYDENAASATKLQTARTLWGQSFDGTGNVSGAMTGVSTISASGNITTSGIVYTNGKANTGDQDLSNLSTYSYVDNNFLNLTGGTMTGNLTAPNYLRSDGATIWHSGNDGAGSGLDADLLDGTHLKSIIGYDTKRDFTNGTLITTNIDYSVSYGDPFYLEIKGNAYNRGYPCLTQAQGYIYYDTIINYGVTHLGYVGIFGLIALNVSGRLCFWFPRQEYWEGYSIFVSSAYSTSYNRVIAVDDVAKPAGTKEVNISEHTSTSAFLNSNVASATKLQTTRTIWGQNFDGSGNVDGTLSIRPTNGVYNEGIRIHKSPSNWATLMFCGLDNTGDADTSTNSWGIFNSDTNNFYINRNGSSTNTGYELCNVNGNWGVGTNAPAYKLDVNGTGKFAGKLMLDAAEGLGVYGIRGRTANEQVEMYQKVSIGSPNGWGVFPQAPAFGLSVYGGANFCTNQGNVLIGTTTDAGYKLDVAGTLRATGAVTLGSTLNVAGNISASGSITASNLWGIASKNVSLTLTTNWQDTGILMNDSTLFASGSGTYIIELYSSTPEVSSQWDMRYSGVIAVFTTQTNSTDTDEIILHSMGHASNGRHIYLRTVLQTHPNYAKIQIATSTTWTGAGTITIKTRRII